MTVRDWPDPDEDESSGKAGFAFVIEACLVLMTIVLATMYVAAQILPW